MIEDNFKKMCGRMGGEYIKDIDSQCILKLSKFRDFLDMEEAPGLNIIDSSLKSGGRMNIENVENVEKLINNYYLIWYGKI